MEKEIKIIEYKKEFAAGVADMWNRSSEGWQGDHWDKSEESVRNGEEASSCLKLWIAIANKEVIGYCKLSEFPQDKETWYIDLLNVRPDFFGKKIGKKLLLTAIDYSQKMGISRVDLHTWPGNLKAVPLYKKCGYFWIDRDGSTHLINLIPKVLKQALFQDFFSKADWYKDSTRKIEVVPDGRKEGDFEYWTYSWEKDKETLEIEFCRRGRGIRKIETNDYSITATIADRKLIFGAKYQVKYEIKNKSGKPLKIEIKSKNDEMIKFNFEDSFIVDDERSIEPEFFIDKIDKETNEEKTQPNVIAEFKINGKEVLFEIGISPQFPVKFIVSKNDMSFINSDNECWISVENMSKDDIEFIGKLKADGNVSFKNKEIFLSLKGNEKKTIKNSFLFKKVGKYQNEAEFTIIQKSKKFTYNRDIEFFVRTFTDKLFAKTRVSDTILCGKYYLTMMKKNNRNALFFGSKDIQGGFFFPVPSLGKPYNSEFAQVDPIFESTQNSESISAKITYISKKFLDAKFIFHFELFAGGMLKMFIEIDRGNWKDDLQAITYLWFPKNNATCMSDGKLIRIPNDNSDSYESIWDYNKIDENWIMSKSDDKKSDFTIVWNNEFRMKAGGWRNVFESTIPKEMENFKSKEIFFFKDFFKRVEDVRLFVLQKKVEKNYPISTTDILINNGNPFVENQLTVSVRCNANNKVSGKFSISSDVIEQKSIMNEEKKSIIEITDIKIKRIKGTNILTLNKFENGISKSSKVVFFKKGNDKVNFQEIVENDMKIMTVSNGIIELSTSPDFAPVIHSMKYNDQEWLDSLFPNPGPKSWWNPWAGGMYARNVEINLKTILKEKNTFEFATKKDQFGNEWKGISIKTEFVKNEAMKGTILIQYFLLLSNSPVVARFFEQTNISGFRFNSRVRNNCFFKADSVQNTFYEFTSETDEKIQVQGGISEEYFNTKLGKFFNFNRSETVFITTPFDVVQQEMGANSEIINSSISQTKLLETDEIKISKPSFIIFSEEDINHNWLDMLRRIEL